MAAEALTADEARAMVFPVASLGEGYNRDAVEAFRAQVVEALTALTMPEPSAGDGVSAGADVPRWETLRGEHARLEQQVDDLRAFEREYRARLRTYLTDRLADLDLAAAEALALPRPGSVGTPPC